MSEHLANLGILRDVIRMHQPAQASHDSTLELILLELVNRIEHLEAQQETPASASQSTEQPVPSSSEATWTQAATPRMSPTSLTVSSPVSRDGFLDLSVQRVISDWLSSRQLAGSVQEVEIRLTLTSKASTPPTGSASPSTAEPTPEANGVAGSYDMGPFLEADGYPLSPASSPEPAQGGGEWMPGTGHCFYPHPTIEGMTCSLAPNHEGNHSTSRYWPSRIMKEGSERG